jgi:hypothetical protein
MQKVSTVIPSGLRFAFAAVMVAGAVGGAAGQAGSTVAVNAGDNLQAALDAAQPGQTLLLAAGATFTGNFVLPKKAGTSTAYITIRTATADRRLPDDDERIAPADEPLLPTIHSPNALPAIRTAAGAHHWRILCVRVTGGGGTGDVIDLGDPSQTDRTQIPTDLIVDRVVLRGDAAKGQKRGIGLNSANTWVRNSHITGIKLAGQETQAIAGWNGPGPFVIENNYIEPGSIGILFGGAPPAVDQLTPTDIVIRHNYVSRPLELRTGNWVIKNLLELKHARNVQVTGNVFENNWSGGQSGFAIVLTPRANGNAPWTVLEHVRFENNIVRHSGSAINLLGYDSNDPTQQTRDIVIRNNEFTDIDQQKWGGGGIFLQIGDEPADVHLEHNTVVQSGNIISAYGGTAAAPRKITGFRFADNIVMHNTYGIYGNQVGMGNVALAAYFPQSVVTGNVIAGGPSNAYPSGNSFPAVTDLLSQFRNASAGDYSLLDASPLRVMVSGLAGADFDELRRATMSPPRAPKSISANEVR